MPFTLEEGGFGMGDYVAFGVLCSASCAGGLWYSAVGSKTKAVLDVKDYLLGGKSMSTFPVAMSLIASYVSGVTILGTPAEIYNYGTQYWLVIIGVAMSCVVVATVYLPVFCTLRLSSSYEYLELRFNRHVRAVASVLFLLDEVLFLPMVVYVPALAFNQLTGMNVFAIGGIMVVICGLYTVLGGLRAVVWTDSVQTGMMFIGVLLVATAGTLAAGGVHSVLNIANDAGRLEISNWEFSPYVRQTGWGSMVGGFLYWTCFNSVNQTMVQRYISLPTKRQAVAPCVRQTGWGSVVGGFLYWTCFNSVNQTMVQRYISLPTKRQAVAAIGIFCIGAMIAISLCVWCGLAAFAAWVLGGCSPSGAPLVDDRLLPAFVTYVSTVQHLPGLAGVFLAGVFGAGLSSLSAVLNACALVVVEDIMHGWMRLHLKPFTEGILARVATAVLAIISVIMLMVIEKLGGVLGVATALSAIAASATCGIFTLGMVCWWVGPRGAIAGGVAGALVAGTVSLGTQAAAASGLRAPPLNLTAECAANASFVFDNEFGAPVAGTVSLGTQAAAASGLRAPPLNLTAECAANASFVFDNEFDPQSVFPLFRVSYHWIAPLGLLATLLVGAIIGWLFDKKEDIRMDEELFTPIVWNLLPNEAHERAGETRRIVNAKSVESPRPTSPLMTARANKLEMSDEVSR